MYQSDSPASQKKHRTHYFISRLERRNCLSVFDDIYIVWTIPAFQQREMPLSSPSPGLDMSCHRMDIAFRRIRRRLRTNFTLHSTALDLTEMHRETERDTQTEKPTRTGEPRRDEGFAAGAGSNGGRERVELNVRRPHSLIPVEAANVLPSLTTSLSPRACWDDGAILIPRCGFMNKISGLSDGGV